MVVTIGTITPGPGNFAVAWSTDVPANTSASLRISRTQDGLSDPSTSIVQPTSSPIPGSAFVATAPSAAPFLAPGRTYFIQCEADGTLSAVSQAIIPFDFAKVADLDAIKLVINNWLQAVINPTYPASSQVDIRFGWQSDPKALKPFVRYMVTGPDKPHVTDDVVIEQDGNPYAEGPRTFQVMVHVFSDDETAAEMAAALLSSFEQPQFYDVFEAGGLGLNPPQDFACSVTTIQPVVDLSQLLDTKYERHSMIEFQLVVSVKASLAAAGSIEHVNTDGTVDSIDVPIVADK